MLDDPGLVPLALAGSKKATPTTVILILSRIEMLEEDLRSMTSVLAEMRLKLSGDIEENPGPRVFTHFSDETGGTTVQKDVVIFTASGGEKLNTLWIKDLSSSANFLSVGIQLVRSGGSPLAIPITLPVTSLDGKWLYYYQVGPLSAILEVETSMFDEVTLAAGDTIVASWYNLYSGTTYLRIMGGSLPAAAATGVMDVNVVGFSQQNNPVWTTAYDPDGPVIIPPPGKTGYYIPSESPHFIPSAVPVLGADVKKALRKKLMQRHGDVETNPGPAAKARVQTDGQFEYHRPARGKYDDHFETDKLNPYVELDVDSFVEKLESAANELPGPSREWMLVTLDPDRLFNASCPRDMLYSEMDSREVKETVKTATNSLQGISDRGNIPRRPKEEVTKDVKEQGNVLVNKGRQLTMVAQRIANKFATWGDMVDWVCGSIDEPPSHLVDLVFENCCKREKPLVGKTTADYWVAEGLGKKRTTRTIFQGLSAWSRSLATLSSAPMYKVWEDLRFHSGDESPCDVNVPKVALHGTFNEYGNEQLSGCGANSDWKRVLALSWNKKMHAMNGNMAGNWEFPNDMKEIESYGELSPLVEQDGDVTGPEMDPVEEVARMTGLLGPQGIINSSVPRELAMRGAVVSTTNIVTQINDLNHPEALLYPLEVRNGVGAALINQVNRPKLFGVGLVRRKTIYPLELTLEGAAIDAIVARQSNIRPDQFAAGGFRTSDMAALIKTEPLDNGDSMLAPFLKLQLYNLTRAWRVDPAFLPLGSEPGKFDSFTALAMNPAVQLDFNAGTVFGIDCGGTVAPEMPYLAGGGLADATIAFHNTKATIRQGEAWIAMDALLNLQNEMGYESLNIALLALAFAPYPCGIHSVLIDTVDTAGGNADIQEFVPNSDLIHIPGIKKLNILLPCDVNGPPPNAYAQANAQVLVKPTAGPTAAGALLADQELQVNALTQPYVEYVMADYFTSWMADPPAPPGAVSPIDMTTLTRFTSQLGQLTRRTKDHRFAWELACTLTVRYPAMVEAVPNTPTYLAVNSAGSVAQQNYFGLKPAPMTADYPEEQNQYDIYIPDINPLWFCKIMMGTHEAAPDDGPDRACFSWDSSPRTLQYAIHTTRDYAVTAEALFTYLQYPVEIWNNAFTQLNYVGILSQIRAMFARATLTPNGEAMISETGQSLALLHTRLNGFKPASDMFGFTIWDYLNTPRTGFQGVLSAAGAELLTPKPCVLADIWVQIESYLPTMALTPLLSVAKMLTGIPLSDGNIVPLAAGGYCVPVPISQQAREVGLRTVPEINEKALFNSRLVWHTFPSSLYTLGGALYNTSTIATGNVVAQKSVRADWTIGALLNPTVLTANTRWMPFMNNLGQRLAVGVTAANGAALMSMITSKKSTTGVATWLVRGANAMPNVIVDGGGMNTQNKMARRRMPGNAQAILDPVSEDGEGIQNS
jgi:hypothetical protein